jgi:hypothetical protein
MKILKRPGTLIFIFLFILISLTGYLSYKNHQDYSNTIQHQWQDQLSTTVRLTKQNLQNFFDKFSENLIVVSKDPIIQSKSCNKKIKVIDSNYCPLFNLYNVHKDFVNAIILLNTKSKILIRFPKSDGIIEKDGNCCARNIDTAYVPKINSVYISNVFENKFNEPTITISCPVFYNDSFTGIVRWMFTPAKISNRFIDSINIGNKGFLWIIDNHGFIVSHPDSALRYKRMGLLIKVNLKHNLPNNFLMILMIMMKDTAHITIQ